MSDEIFDFSALKESVYLRFVELLQHKTLCQLMCTDKANYISCITSRGINVLVVKWMLDKELEVCFTTCGNLVLKFGRNEQYQQFETKYSKFMPYFKFHQVNLFHECVGPLAVEPTLFPKEYTRLHGLQVTEFVHMDNVLAFVHPRVDNVTLQFHCAPEAGLTYCNFIMSKLPDMRKFEFTFWGHFTVGPVSLITTAYLDLLLIPKPTTIVRFAQLTVLDVTHKDGEWLDTYPY